MRFIQIDEKIMDYQKYSRELFLVKSHLLMCIYDIASEHGFMRQESVLINKELNCIMKISFEKAEPEKLV